MRERVEIVDVPIDYLDMDTFVASTVEAARTGRHFQIATVNLDFLVRSHRDAEVHAILHDAAINMPDGAPVVWAGKLLGLRGIDRVAGADFVPQLMQTAAAEGLRVFFLGGEDGVAREAADLLIAEHPGLVVAVYEPPRAALSEMNTAEILRHIADARAQILLVAFGHPKQEQWIRRNAASLPMVAVGVGCCFDLIAGRQTRAPRWAQRFGLEWVYRLLHEPRRLFRRYAADAIWVFKVLFPWALAQRRARRVTPAPHPPTSATGHRTHSAEADER